MIMAGILFASGRVSVVQKNLLSADKIGRLATSADLKDAVKILSEYGYGGGIVLSSPFAYEEALVAEENALNAFMREILPENSGMDLWFKEADFHNAKVIAKERFFSSERVVEAINEHGLIPVADLTRKLSTGEYDGLYPEMVAAFRDFERKNEAGKLLSSFIDVRMDQAFFDHAFSELKKCRDRALTAYFRDRIDGMNLNVFLRSKRIGLSSAELNDKLISGGNYPVETYVKNYDREIGEFKRALSGSVWAGLLGEYEEDPKASVIALETATDNALLATLAKRRYEMETLGSILFYYRSKMTEIKNLRIILTGKKNKVDNKAITSRLRKTYA